MNQSKPPTIAEWVEGASLGQRVAFLEGAARVAKDKLATLEQICGLPQVGALTLEQRVQALEMSVGYHRQALESLLSCIKELGRVLGIPDDDPDLQGEAPRPDTRAPETPTT